MGCGAKKDEVTVMAVQREVKTQAEKSSSEIELQREIEESSVGIKQTKETVEEIENILETTENVESNVISWTNAEIEKQALIALGKSYEEKVTIEEAATIININENPFSLRELDQNGFSDLKYLPNLQGLDVDILKLEDISFIKYLPNLKELYIDSQELRDLSPLQNNQSIEKLEINTYGLEDLNGLSGMTKLEYLNVQSDILSDVSAISSMISLSHVLIISNTLQTLNIDFSNIPNITIFDVVSNALTDVTSFSSFQFRLKGGDVCQQIYVTNNEQNLSEESLRVLAKLIYDGCVYAAPLGIETTCVGVNVENNDDQDKIMSYCEEMLETLGRPEVIKEMPQGPSIEMPATWEEFAIDFDGQLLSVPCTLQSLFEYGYMMENFEIDLTNRIEAGDTYSFYMYKANSIRINVTLQNLSDVQAMKLEECTVTEIMINKKDLDENNLPELFLPTDLEKRHSVDKYTTYITWEDWPRDVEEFSFTEGSGVSSVNVCLRKSRRGFGVEESHRGGRFIVVKDNIDGFARIGIIILGYSPSVTSNFGYYLY